MGKKCRTCQIIKSDFHRDRARPDGLQANCKTCRRSFARNYYLRRGNAIRRTNRIKAWLRRWIKKNGWSISVAEYIDQHKKRLAMKQGDDAIERS